MKDSKWYKATSNKVEQILQSKNNDLIRKFKVDLLKKMVDRVEEFSHQGCEKCETQQQQNINTLIAMIEDLTKGKQVTFKAYHTVYKETLTHLKKEHGLVEPGQYMNQYLVLGLLFGGAFTYFSIYAVSFGLTIGIIIGALLDSDAKKKGKQF
jgi:hypothetical protein